MSQTTPPALMSKKTSWVQLGGSIGLAGAIISLATFVLGCFGFIAAFAFSILSIIAGVVGTMLILMGVTCHKDSGPEETSPMAASFPCIMAGLGGLLELAVWMNWEIVPGMK